MLCFGRMLNLVLMKFSVGDKVVFKATGEEGVVRSVLDRNLVEVESGGVLFPAYTDDLEHPYLKWFMEKKTRRSPKAKPDIPQPESRGRQAREEQGLWLSFLTVSVLDDFEEMIQSFKVHLVNETAAELSVDYQAFHREGTLFELSFPLPPFTSFYLHDLSFADAGMQPRFSLRFSRNNAQNEHEELSATLRLKPRQLMQEIEQMRAGNKAVFTLPFSGDFQKPETVKKPLSVGESRPKSYPAAGKGRRTRKTPIDVLDLHLESLAPHARSWSNFEILTLQLNTLEDALATAIALRQESMIVIHGVGKGKLKEEVHRLLRSYREVRFFQQSWSPRFGFGATEIFFET